MPATVPPATPSRARARRSCATAIVVGLALLLALSACTGRPRAPTKYGDTTRKNFLSGCEAPDNSPETGFTVPARVCVCAYTAIVKQIPFAEFKKINDDLGSGGTRKPLPPKMQKILDSCK